MIEVTAKDWEIAAKVIRCSEVQQGADFIATHRIEAAKAERDRIVAWLREMGSIRGGVADAIEAGEHFEESQP